MKSMSIDAALSAYSVRRIMSVINGLYIDTVDSIAAATAWWAEPRAERCTMSFETSLVLQY